MQIGINNGSWPLNTYYQFKREMIERHFKCDKCCDTKKKKRFYEEWGIKGYKSQSTDLEKTF